MCSKCPGVGGGTGGWLDYRYHRGGWEDTCWRDAVAVGIFAIFTQLEGFGNTRLSIVPVSGSSLLSNCNRLFSFPWTPYFYHTAPIYPPHNNLTPPTTHSPLYNSFAYNIQTTSEPSTPPSSRRRRNNILNNNPQNPTVHPEKE